jgi:hypothetical protein
MGGRALDCPACGAAGVVAEAIAAKLVAATSDARATSPVSARCFLLPVFMEQFPLPIARFAT